MKRFPLPRSNMSIVIYGKKDCKYCTAAKRLLDDIGLKYTYYSIEQLVKDKIINKPTDLLNILKEKKKMPEKFNTVPIIFHFGEFLGGFSQLHDIISIAKPNKIYPTLDDLCKKYPNKN